MLFGVAVMDKTSYSHSLLSIDKEFRIIIRIIRLLFRSGLLDAIKSIRNDLIHFFTLVSKIK